MTRDTESAIEDIYDEIDHEMEITRWDQYGFPFEGEEADGVEFPYGYWPAQFNVQEIRLDSIESSDTIPIGDELEASGIGHYAHLYPEPEKIALTEEHIEDYRFTLRDEYEGEILVEVPAKEIDFTAQEGFSSFETVIPTEDVEEGGDYTLQFEILENGEEEYITAGKIITVTEAYFEIDIIDYTSEVEEGETLTVEYEVKNTGGAGDTQNINFTVDGELVDAHTNISLNPDENKTGEFTWENSKEGEYKIKIESEDDKGNVTVTVKKVSIPEFFEVNIIEYPREVKKDETLTVEYEIYNTGGTEDTQDINFTVDGELVDAHTNITLNPGENKTGEFTWKSDEKGEYKIKIESEDDKSDVTITVKEEDEGIPGFTLHPLIIATLVSLVWYRQKIKDRNTGKQL
ncbi:MAG: CARDB domain-containing protein [Thermoplasmata archaeon]